MKDVVCRVEVSFVDCKRHVIHHVTLASDGFYDIDQYLHDAINDASISPDPDDKFEIISFKMYNLRFVHPDLKSK